MLYEDEKVKLRPYFFRMLRRLGWNVLYDGNKDFKDQLLDINLFLTKKVKKDDGSYEQNYGFLQIAYTSKCSYENFKETKNATNDEFAKFVNEVDSMIYPYDLDDVVCQLLHLGYHLKDVYTVQNGKLNLKLSKKIIQELCTEFVRKGSPLLDQSSLRRPKRLKGRAPVKTFYNIEVFGPNGKIPDGALYAN